MQPLNPFIRAFTKSSLPSQCTPIQNYILLVPTTEVLLNSFNFESGTSYAELAVSEEFLGSHILRVPNQHAGALEESPNMRETRGKAKQYSTFNGKIVVIKDSFVYSNKGFKTHNQAQLLSDALLYPDSLEPRQWLIYYISQPLVGTLKEIKMPIAHLPKFSPEGKYLSEARITSEGEELVTGSSLPKKKLIKTFNGLLNYFPMIARQLQPGLEHIFKEFNMVFERPLPPPPSADIIPDPEPAELKATNFLAARFNSKNSSSSLRLDSYSGQSVVEVMDFEDEEEIMRGALETAITAAIDLFQMVDKQQLSLLGATTDLTGPVVERMIEQYISEQVHSNILYPRICALRRTDDLAIESLIKEMTFVDISQVGISIQGGQKGKHELIIRLGRAVDEFRNLNIAGSPQQMMSILLCTLKTVSQLTEPLHMPINQELAYLENSRPVLTINADALVSLLLVVIIRAKVRHLHARLAYMRNFIFVDDVESGEMGYALSTFEAVLSYITYNSAGLRKASAKNKRLWQATKQGDIPAIKKILEPEIEQISKEDEICDDKATSHSFDRSNPLDSFVSCSRENSFQNSSSISTLSHVYPWQYRPDLKVMEEPEQRKKKTVTMDIQSLSGSSDKSFHSRAPTIDSISYGIEGDTSIERLSQTQDIFGESLLMMAVQNQQGESLKYLLSLKNYYPPDFVLGDVNNEGTTLLSAAVQLGYSKSINTLLEFLFMQKRTVIKDYLRLQDVRGRSVAHYLFNAPSLITSVGYLLSWRQKDKNGQTPLFAICRSYDHRCYRMMVETALASAKFSSANGELLHLDDHVDAKGNTLLHIINDPQIAYKILTQCHANVNATNNKKFTPLMVASKYGRTEMIRVLFGDERTDIFARELRGLAAVELAKDDDVRNRIDDLTLFQGQPAADGRITSVVRSFFVQDATIRLVIKSAAPTSHESYTITTCRRSLADFYHLANLLALENPASWLPSISGMRNPFQLISRPSRSVLRDIQIRLDNFLKIMLSHSTFATHEMLWEFFLVPDIQSEMMEARSKLKMETRIEKVREEYKPVENVRDVEQFVSYARDMVRSVNHTTKNVARRANQMWIATTDLHESYQLASRIFSTLEGLPSTHIEALEAYVTSLEPSSTHPYSNFHSAILSLHSTVIAMLMALSRPKSLISTISAINKSIERSLNSLSRSTRWPLGLLDETRQRLNDEKEERIRKERTEVGEVGRELRYTWGVVAGELAGWQEAHEKMGRKAIKQLVRGMVVRERTVLEGMERAYRKLNIPITPVRPPDLSIPTFLCETDDSTEYLAKIEADENEEEKALMNIVDDSVNSKNNPHDKSSFGNF
ncbi:putative vps9 domain protein [Golovinomyces cichoracearum]|uniref:Putative vps9 domain protein n=1 Tax=Golovinomyces cichoracearum TaxID=62708 RepID=A0A420IZG3_9PEZI|nr:putative vps9 domain protein [Golovinomyces cichoracearum]